MDWNDNLDARQARWLDGDVPPAPEVETAECDRCHDRRVPVDELCDVVLWQWLEGRRTAGYDAKVCGSCLDEIKEADREPG